MAGARRSEVGGLVVDEVEAGRGRVKRVIYPPGWRWKTDMAPVTGGDLCMHAHVGFLVQGRMVVEYQDGCRETYQAPAAVVVAPGHDGWVEGEEVRCAGAVRLWVGHGGRARPAGRAPARLTTRG